MIGVYVFKDGKFMYTPLDMLASYLLHINNGIGDKSKKAPKVISWSARLSTGGFGLHACKAGNNKHAPRNEREVLLGLGDSGLVELVSLGFVPCVVCKPEVKFGEWFWSPIRGLVVEKYGLKTPDEFADKSKVGYDARRLDWEKILPITGGPPNMICASRGLSQDEVDAFQERIRKIGFEIPRLTYYDFATKSYPEYKLRK